MKYDVAVIGAGAAGLSFACELISKTDKNIIIIDAGKVCGRKLASSGNGKCNITNAYFSSDCYVSDDEISLNKLISSSSNNTVINFFENLGILTYEKNGYYYPFSNRGNQLRDTMVSYLLDRNVIFKNEFMVSDIIHDDLYKIKNKNGEAIEAENVILAFGGCSYKQLGGEDNSLLFKKLHLQTVKPYPCLAPVYIDDKDLHIAKGVRMDADVTVKINGEYFRDSGQIQINDKDLSGIVMMNLSCHINRAFCKGDTEISFFIDTLPKLKHDMLLSRLKTMTENEPDLTVIRFLNMLLPNAFNLYLLKRLNIENDTKLSDLSVKNQNRIVSNIKKLTFAPVKKFDYDKAQVMGGGINLCEINTDTMESIRQEGMYIIGEALDVQGICGGYNISFAVCSGLRAAGHIIGMNND